MKKPIYDLHHIAEDDRIDLLGSAASSGKSVAFILEDDKEKIARYLRKLQERFPDVKVERLGKLTKGCMTFRATRVQN